jgi:hypothetical protein
MKEKSISKEWSVDSISSMYNEEIESNTTVEDNANIDADVPTTNDYQWVCPDCTYINLMESNLVRIFSKFLFAIF